MNTPLVSVVVPLYNKSSTIARTLRSIANQTFGDHETIVVNDGSTDEGAAVAQQFANARLRVVHQPNAGPGAARNRGIAEARGELLAFLDADDEWLPRYLERAVATLQRYGPGVASVTFGYVVGPEAKSTRPFWARQGLPEGPFRLSEGTRAPLASSLLRYMTPWSTVIRRSIVERYGGFYGNHCRYGEDSYLFLKVLFNETVAADLEPLTHWHDEASQLSRNIVGARAIEPMLRDPKPLYETCPPRLRGLLDELLAIRAGKTSCMLGFWGQWRESRALVRRFCRLSDLRYRPVLLGYLCATPIAGFAGAALRSLPAFVAAPTRLGSASWRARDSDPGQPPRQERAGGRQCKADR